MDELRRYELYVIFQPELDEDDLESRIGRLNGYLTANDGEIIEVVRKGKRRLAYSINRFNQGIDVIYQLNLPARRLEVLERQMNLFEDIMRYLIVRRDDLAAGERLTATPEQIAQEVAALQARPTEIELREAESAATVAETPVAASEALPALGADLALEAASESRPVSVAEIPYEEGEGA